jgi:type III secretory pathway component EscV
MALARYTLLRVLLFLVVAALLWIAGLRGFWLLLVAIIGSGIISIFALSRSRDAASASVANRVAEAKRRAARRADAEDAWDEQQRANSVAPRVGDTSSEAENTTSARGVPTTIEGMRQAVTDDRRTWPNPTPGEDPRERDEELSSPTALENLEAQEGLVNPQQPVDDGIGASSTTSPGRDLPDPTADFNDQNRANGPSEAR